MIKNRDKYPNLLFVIISDLFLNAKLPIFLLLLIMVSGVAVVIITYKTRELIIIHEKIVLEKEALEIENRHLMLEEKVLFDLSNIEHFAIKNLNMKFVVSNEKNVIYFYN